ncbi:MAG: hypothetical protein JWM11_6860 [Planctomycetaceae bacterium]|nr:hypothetical protein [Planctomycetaceae bacterium]
MKVIFLAGVAVASAIREIRSKYADFNRAMYNARRVSLSRLTEEA